MGSTAYPLHVTSTRPQTRLRGVLPAPAEGGGSPAPLLDNGGLDSVLSETEDALRRSYWFDPASGLLHRELFLDRLGQAAAGVARGGACFAVVVIGVSLPVWAATSTSTLFSTLGHRLVEMGRRSDSFSTLEPGCFAGLLLGNHSVAGSVAMAHKLVEQLARPVVAEGRHGTPRAAAGVALCPQHGHEARRMLLNAHAAMALALTARQAVSVYAAR